MEIMPLPESISRKRLNEAIDEGRIIPIYETEWAKDEDGIARPVGRNIVGYEGAKSGKRYYVVDELTLR